MKRIWWRGGDSGFSWEGVKKGIGCLIENTAKVFHPATVTLGDNVYVAHGVHVRSYPQGYVKIGSDSCLSDYVCIDGYGGVIIGDLVAIGEHVVIHSGGHDLNDLAEIILSRKIPAPVIIGKGSDIGAGTYIKPGVKIGDGVQIGANSVVVCNIPDYEVWGGVPAQHIKDRSVDFVREKIGINSH